MFRLRYLTGFWIRLWREIVTAKLNTPSFLSKSFFAHACNAKNLATAFFSLHLSRQCFWTYRQKFSFCYRGHLQRMSTHFHRFLTPPPLLSHLSTFTWPPTVLSVRKNIEYDMEFCSKNLTQHTHSVTLPYKNNKKVSHKKLNICKQHWYKMKIGKG